MYYAFVTLMPANMGSPFAPQNLQTAHELALQSTPTPPWVPLRACALPQPRASDRERGGAIRTRGEGLGVDRGLFLPYVYT